jgi:hypothetical protein
MDPATIELPGGQTPKAPDDDVPVVVQRLSDDAVADAESTMDMVLQGSWGLTWVDVGGLCYTGQNPGARMILPRRAIMSSCDLVRLFR